MSLVRTPALILHTFPYGDTSRILRVLTPDYGLRSVIAKGARNPRSRFGGVLEPFTEGEAQFTLREGRDLLTLTGFSLSRSRQGIGRALASFTGASLLAEIALRVGTEEPHPELYHLLTAGLDRLAEPSPAPEATALTALWSLIGIVGFRPEMETCLRCDRRLLATEDARFDVEGGGIVCKSCRREGRILPAPVRTEIIAMNRGEIPPIPVLHLRVHGALLDAFLPAHLSPERGLRSLALFRDQLG